MPVQLEFRGADDFRELSRKLRAAGLEGKGLRKEVLKEVNRATKPLKQDAKRNAKAILPKRGGLGRRVAASNFSTKTRMTGNGAGVKILAKGKGQARGVRQIDAGRVRHPVFGSKRRWVTQSVTPGWFTDAMKRGSGKIKDAIVDAVNSIIRKL